MRDIVLCRTFMSIARGMRYGLRSTRRKTVDGVETKGTPKAMASSRRPVKRRKSEGSEELSYACQSQTVHARGGSGKKYLIKSEPSSFSILDLEKEPNQTTHWDGVRNYQARNILKEMRLGDLCLFYHSNSTPSGIVGIVRVVKTAYPDHTSWNKEGTGYDPASTETDPKWVMVDVQLVRKFTKSISLARLKSFKEKELHRMMLFVNSRLSVQTVEQHHWDFVLSLE